MHRSMHAGIFVLGVLWAVMAFVVKDRLQEISPPLWSVLLWCLCAVSILYGVYCLFRIVTAKRSKAEWFARSGVMGEFSLKPENHTYFSRIHQYASHGEEIEAYIVRFLWVGEHGRQHVAEIPIEKIFLSIKEHHEGPPVVKFMFRDVDAPEPFLHIRPRLRKPSWWLQKENAEKLGFLYAHVVIGREDYLVESVLTPFLPSHIHQ